MMELIKKLEMESMVMLRPGGKAQKIAENVMKRKGIKVRKPKANDKKALDMPYLQH